MGRVVFALVVVLSSPSWGAEPPRPTPEQDLKTAQGRWRFDPKSGSLWDINDPKEKVPALFRSMAVDGVVLAIDGNRLTVGKGEPISIANDLDFPNLQEQVEKAVRGQRLVLLTLASGKGLLASYSVDKDSLDIHYPAGCCSRSGHILVFRRVKE